MVVCIELIAAFLDGSVTACPQGLVQLNAVFFRDVSSLQLKRMKTKRKTTSERHYTKPWNQGHPGAHEMVRHLPLLLAAPLFHCTASRQLRGGGERRAAASQAIGGARGRRGEVLRALGPRAAHKASRS